MTSRRSSQPRIPTGDSSRRRLDKNEATSMLTENQHKTLTAIRKYEEKNKEVLGPQRSFSRKFKAGIDRKNLFNETQRLRFEREFSKRLTQIKVPALMPLKFPHFVLQEIKEGKIKKISISVRRDKFDISYMDKNRQTKVLIKNQDNSFEGHSEFKEKEPKNTGLDFQENSKLKLNIPSSQAVLTSRLHLNDGEVLYKLNKNGIGTTNV